MRVCGSPAGLRSGGFCTAEDVRALARAVSGEVVAPEDGWGGRGYDGRARGAGRGLRGVGLGRRQEHDERW